MLRPVGGEQEAQAALQSVKAEKQALEECLSATASAHPRATTPAALAASRATARTCAPSASKVAAMTPPPCPVTPVIAHMPVLRFQRPVFILER